MIIASQYLDQPCLLLTPPVSRQPGNLQVRNMKSLAFTSVSCPCFSAGIDVDLAEVLLLGSRYCVEGTRYSWASQLVWPALLRDLGVVPGGVLPPGTSASLSSLHQLLDLTPQV